MTTNSRQEWRWAETYLSVKAITHCMAAASKFPTVYILASRKRGALYVGVTSDLETRLRQHKSTDSSGFTRRYGILTLVYFEVLPDMETAIALEKRLKRWRRAWKIELIEERNPNWDDLFQDLCHIRNRGAELSEVPARRLPRRPG